MDFPLCSVTWRAARKACDRQERFQPSGRIMGATATSATRRNCATGKYSTSHPGNCLQLVGACLPYVQAAACWNHGTATPAAACKRRQHQRKFCRPHPRSSACLLSSRRAKRDRNFSRAQPWHPSAQRFPHASMPRNTTAISHAGNLIVRNVATGISSIHQPRDFVSRQFAGDPASCESTSMARNVCVEAGCRIHRRRNPSGRSSVMWLAAVRLAP